MIIEDFLAHQAVRALTEELVLTPKPGLVDLHNNGAHKDLTLRLMLDSAFSLQESFQKMASAAQSAKIDQQLRNTIGQIGRDAEQAMLKVTGGTNTHKGAIWAIGLLVTAAAYLKDAILHLSFQEYAILLCNTAGKLASIEDEYTGIDHTTHGKKMIEKYKVIGAKQQAQLGFPILQHYAIPALIKCSFCQVKIKYSIVFLKIMANLDDTCILSRTNLENLKLFQKKAKNILRNNMIYTKTVLELTHKIDREMIKINASPGGSADMLACTIFIDLLYQNKTQFV